MVLHTRYAATAAMKSPVGIVKHFRSASARGSSFFLVNFHFVVILLQMV